MESDTKNVMLPEEKLLPQDGKKDWTVALKSISSALTFGEMIFNAVMRATDPKPKTASEISSGSGGSSGSGTGSGSGGVLATGAGDAVTARDALESGVELIISLCSFAISLGVGYGCYSPMDVSEEMKHSHSKYAEKIKTVNSVAHAYTVMWWIKSILSMFTDGTRVVMYFTKKDSQIGSWLVKGIKGINTAVYGAALITECVADGYAGSVAAESQDGDYVDEAVDKKVFLSDTTGYIFFDAKSIMDNVYDLGVDKCLSGKAKLIYVLCREVLAIGCGVSESVATAYINGTLK